MSPSLPKLLLAALVTSCLGCGDEPPPAPAAAPEEFDDPFADDEDPAAEEAPAAAEDPALAAAVPPAAADSDTPALAGSDAPADVDDLQGESGGPSTAEPGSADDGPAVDDAKPRSAGEEAAAPSSKPSKPSKPSTKSIPAPDKPPSPPNAETPPAPAVDEPAAAQPKPTVEAKPAPPAVKEPPPPPPEARFVGTYRFAGGSAQRQRLKDAIDVAVEQLNALIRGVGRRRLNESNQIRDQIDITVNGDKVTTKFTPGGTLTATLGAASIPWTTDTGNKVQAKVKMVKGRLVQDFKSDDGARRSVFTLNESGDTLTLSVTISSDRLPVPVKYALTYKRK